MLCKLAAAIMIKSILCNNSVSKHPININKVSRPMFSGIENMISKFLD